MMRFNSEDEIVIQNKIDGNLSEEDEKRFNELIENSSEARNFYRNLTELDLSLKNDSGNVPTIDFSDEIMKKVHSLLREKRTILFASVSLKQMISYAAVLLIGLLIGGISVYLGTTITSPDVGDISGTMSNSSENEQVYSKDGTDIKVQQLRCGKWEMLTVAVNSQKKIQFEISGKNEKIAESDVKLQFSEGEFFLNEATKGRLDYACSGNNVFQINLSGFAEKISIRFIVDNQVIFEAESE